MKATVERPDGTTITIEGKPVEVAEALRALAETPVREVSPPAYVPQPVYVPTVMERFPWWRTYEWTCGTVTLDVQDTPVTAATTLLADAYSAMAGADGAPS